MKSKLLKNTIYLYLLTFSSQLLNLITIPYQTRVFGPEIYGMVGFAISIMSYIQLVLDFGFILSGTESVSSHENNREYLSEIFSIITFYKIICGIFLIIILFILCQIIPSFKHVSLLILLYSIAYWVNALLPDYIYRGLEQMRYITLRTVLVKLIFTVLIFVFIHNDSDYILLPILLLVGNIIAVFISWINIYKEFGIRYKKFSFINFKHEILKSLPFFCSRIASTAYQATNTLILGMYFSGQKVVGYYTSADKIVSISKSVSSPIADSLYPYMLKNKNYTLIKKILLIYLGFAVLLAPIVFIFAEKISVILFGVGYESVGNIVRCLLPTLLVIFPTYIICFPVLNPLGLSNYANMSNIFGAVLQILLLLLLILFNQINIYTICISSSITETSVFVFRLVIWIKNRQLIKEK